MPPKILVVDDEKDIVEVLGHVFRREGWNVVAAHDGRSALDAVRKDRPDLVILDLMLPEIQGMDVLKTLKGDEGMRNVPVLLLTAKGEEIDREDREAIEAAKDDDLLYVDEVEDEDKMFIFQWTTGGTADIATFRQQASTSLAAVASGQKPGNASKSASRSRGR